MPSHGCTSTHPESSLNGEGGKSESEILCRTRVDVFGERGGSHVVSMERISSLPLCTVNCSALHPSRAASKGRLMRASSPPLTFARVCVCVCLKETCVYQLCVNLWIYVCAHVITNFPIFLKAVILLETTEDSRGTLARTRARHARAHTGYHLQAISQAIPSKEPLFLPVPVWLFLSKSDTALIISSLAYQLLGKRCNCSTEGKKAGEEEKRG